MISLCSHFRIMIIVLVVGFLSGRPFDAWAEVSTMTTPIRVACVGDSTTAGFGEVIDFHTALCGHEALIPDHVHPNAADNEIMASTAYRALTGKEHPPRTLPDRYFRSHAVLPRDVPVPSRRGLASRSQRVVGDGGLAAGDEHRAAGLALGKVSDNIVSGEGEVSRAPLVDRDRRCASAGDVAAGESHAARNGAEGDFSACAGEDERSSQSQRGTGIDRAQAVDLPGVAGRAG